MSSAMYVLELAGASPTRLVLRCYVRPDLNEEEPDLADREAVALGVADDVDVATPALIAHDPTGDAAGVPSVLMTCLPGRVVWDPTAIESWLAGLADVLPAIHDGALDERLGRYASYRQESDAPPAWAVDRVVWERAVEVFHGPLLDGERCFIHRDHHPGNVLWRRGRVSGVVDWQSACVGPPSVDVGHCRANLLRHAPGLADRFTRIAEERSGRAFHPWADVAALVGMLDGLRTNPPSTVGRQAIEAALGQAVSSLR